MTMHPSLGSGSNKKKHRSVLKRFERLSVLKDKEKWNENQSVFGLPKVKTLKVKIKKEKTAEAAAPTEAQASAAAPVQGVKTQTPAAAAAIKKPEAKKEEKKR